MSDATEHAAQLKALIHRRSARVGIVGLGYVGLPLALAFANQGFRVVGFDIDEQRVQCLAAGRSYLSHVPPGPIQEAVARERLVATSDMRRLREQQILLVCVPTPLLANREPDLRQVRNAARAIADHGHWGQLIVLESTGYPGMTREEFAPVLAEAGLQPAQQVFLACSPEREDPGNARYPLVDIPKVVGADDPLSAELAKALYEQVVAQVVEVSSTTAAEATKLTENVYRAVNIALSNELKLVFEQLGVDIWEVLDAAATKPFGFMRFDPGPGWGGHCIPVDPDYLRWKAQAQGVPTRFVDLAGEVNRAMPGHVVQRLQAALAQQGKGLGGSCILLLGLAYKRDVGDIRESPALAVWSQLGAAGANVTYHDPWVPEFLGGARQRLPPQRSVPLTAEVLGAVDGVVLLTDHGQVDYQLVVDHAPLVVDCRGVYRAVRHNHVVRA